MFEKWKENWKNRKIQKHFEDNKDLYVGFAIGAVTVWILKPTARPIHIENSVAPEISPVISPVIHIVTIAEGRGHPGLGVYRPDTGQEWPSQVAAAIAEGINPSILSQHLNGHRPHINDVVYLRAPKIVV